MTNITKIERKAHEDIIDVLERALERARAGEITDIVIVADSNDKNGPHYWSWSQFEDSWRLLGALEYAKRVALSCTSLP